MQWELFYSKKYFYWKNIDIQISINWNKLYYLNNIDSIYSFCV